MNIIARLLGRKPQPEPIEELDLSVILTRLDPDPYLVALLGTTEDDDNNFDLEQEELDGPE